MSIFAGIKDVKVAQQTPPLAPGRYLLEVVKNEHGMTPIEKTPFFRATFKVLENDGSTGANKVGSIAERFILKGKFDYHLKEIAAYVGALVGLTDLSEDDISDLCSAENPAAGSRVRVTVSVKTDDSGNAKKFGDGSPITVTKWFAAEGAPPTVANPSPAGKVAKAAR